ASWLLRFRAGLRASPRPWPREAKRWSTGFSYPGLVANLRWASCSVRSGHRAPVRHFGLAAQSETAGRAAVFMVAFSLGAATPILALAYGSRQAIFARRDLVARASRIAKPLIGAALVSVGAFVLTGFDKVVEASLTSAMPDWMVTVTTRL